MDLNSILVSEFAKITKDNNETVNEGATVYGTYRVDGDGAYVQIDGSDTRTPVTTTSEARNGDRVTVLIKNHRAIITGNLTDPSTTVKSVEERIATGVGDIQETIDNLKTQLDNQEITLDDYRKAIAEAKRMATDYINFTAGTGLVIGSSAISSNVRIYSGGIDIRDGDTILASYTDDVISLGKNSSSSMINMCGGTLKIKAQYEEAYRMNETEIYTINDLLSLAVLNSNGGYKAGITIGAPFDDQILMIGTLFVNDIYDSVAEGSPYLTERVADSMYLGKYETPATHSHSGSDINGGYPTVRSIYLTNPGEASTVALYRSTESGIVGIPRSSRRYKNSIEDVSYYELDPERLYKLPVRQFKWNEGNFEEEEHYNYDIINIGFIAEEVAEVYPFAAVVMDGQIETWEARGLIPPMLALIQQHKKKLDELESRIEVLEKKEV